MDDLLVDARSGVLTSLELHIRSDMPTGWVGWAARVADTRNFGAAVHCFARTLRIRGFDTQRRSGPRGGDR